MSQFSPLRRTGAELTRSWSSMYSESRHESTHFHTACVGIFLGANDASLDALCRHIDYAVDLVGADHVGLATDFPFDVEDFNRELAANPHLFPDGYTRWGAINFMPPEVLLRVDDALRERGYPAEAVTAILGGNFRRVAEQVWQPVHDGASSATAANSRSTSDRSL